MNIIENIKKHPAVTAIVFIGGSVIGLSAFTGAVGDFSETISCIPNHLGITNNASGKGKLIYKVQEYGWVKVGVVSRDRPTGEHGCYSDCEGEPTRTNYSVEVSVNDLTTPKLGNKKLQTPKVSCISGPCGFSQNHGVRLVGDSKAIASFDVWSNPTTWRISADVYQYQVTSEAENYDEYEFKDNSLLVLKIPSNSNNALFEGKHGEDQVFSFNVGDEGKGIFSLASKTTAKEFQTYKYKINDKTCK